MPLAKLHGRMPAATITITIIIMISSCQTASAEDMAGEPGRAEQKIETAIGSVAKIIASTPTRDLDAATRHLLSADKLCADVLAAEIASNNFETPQTARLMKAATGCLAPAQTESGSSTLTTSVLRGLDAPNPSIRALSLELAASPSIPTDALAKITDALENSYQNETVSQVKAAGLRAIVRAYGAAPPRESADPGRMLSDAINSTDDTLRHTASQILSSMNGGQAIRTRELENAMRSEIWPDTSANLLSAALHGIYNATDKSSLLKRTFLDNSIPEYTRLEALRLSDASKTLAPDDMAVLINTGAPISVIATAAELLYSSTPSFRKKLRQWLAIQAPLEDRFIRTFAHFVRTDRQSGRGHELRSDPDYAKICLSSHGHPALMPVCG